MNYYADFLVPDYQEDCFLLPEDLPKRNKASKED
jgi:hypothetical protein